MARRYLQFDIKVGIWTAFYYHEHRIIITAAFSVTCIAVIFQRPFFDMLNKQGRSKSTNHSPLAWPFKVVTYFHKSDRSKYRSVSFAERSIIYTCTYIIYYNILEWFSLTHEIVSRLVHTIIDTNSIVFICLILIITHQSLDSVSQVYENRSSFSNNNTTKI